MTKKKGSKKTKKEIAITALKGLSKNLGWSLLRKVLKENIKITEAKLHGNIDWDKGETLENLQDKRNDRVELLSLPTKMIEDLENNVKDFPEDWDPYE